MRKAISLVAVLGILAGVAACDYSKDETNIFAAGERAEQITARAATFDTSVTSETFITYNSTGLFSDDMKAQMDNGTYRGKGIVDQMTIAYANFIPAGNNETYGTINGGLDNYGFLHILDVGAGKGQPYPWNTTGVVLEDQDHEIKYPSQNLMGGLDVSRKVYVNPWGSVFSQDDFVRWLEILTNNTGSPITVSVVIGGRLYDANQQVMATSDGDAVVEPGDDNWFIMEDGNITTAQDILVGVMPDGSTGYSEVDDMVAATSSGIVLNFSATGTSSYDTNTMTKTPGTQTVLFTWTGVTLNPGETKILMHLANLTPQYLNYWSQGAPDAIESAKMLNSAPPEVVVSMDADEINAVVNWPVARNNCNITGPEGSVDAGVLVSALNETSDQTTQSYSLPDGSFGICLDAAEGDMIQLSVDGKLVKRVKVTAE